MAKALNPSTLFLGLRVEAEDPSSINDVITLLEQAPNVWGWEVVHGGKVHTRSSQLDAADVIKKYETPRRAIMELLGEGDGLPAGAKSQLSECPTGYREQLRRLFEAHGELFPAELPKEIPPNRGLGDVHEIPVEANTKPVGKAPYR